MIACNRALQINSSDQK